MEKKNFKVSFFYPPENLRGTALIIPEDDGEAIRNRASQKTATMITQ
jgi:hypothetical protein